MKIRRTLLDLSTIFMFRLLRNLLGGQPFQFATRAFALGTSPTLPVLAPHSQLGTSVYLGLRTRHQPLNLGAAFTRVGSDFLSQLFLSRQLHGQGCQPSGGSRAGDDHPYACHAEWAHRITSPSEAKRDRFAAPVWMTGKLGPFLHP
jgi:hypothetical protein